MKELNQQLGDFSGHARAFDEREFKLHADINVVCADLDDSFFEWIEGFIPQVPGKHGFKFADNSSILINRLLPRRRKNTFMSKSSNAEYQRKRYEVYAWASMGW